MYPTSGYGPGPGDAMGLAFLAGLTILFVVIGIVLYLLFSFGLYTMANKRNIENPWIAFIPLAQLYTMGELIGPVKIANFDVDQPGLYLLAGAVGLWVLSLIPLLGIIFSLATAVLMGGALYFLFSRYTTDSTPIILTVVSILFLIPGPIIVFVLRNKDYIEPPEISSPM